MLKRSDAPFNAKGSNSQMKREEIVLNKLFKGIRLKLLFAMINRWMIIKKVLRARGEAINRIVSALRGFIRMKQRKKGELMRLILSQRLIACTLIQRRHCNHLHKKQALELSKKVKDCFTIIPSVGAKGDSMQMRIYQTCKTQCVSLNYCSLRKANLIDIPRQKVLPMRSRKLKVNFIINNQVVIDPSYATLQENDTYYNVIDFDLMDRKRAERQKALSDASSFFFTRQWSFNESKSTNEDENEDEYSNIRSKDEQTPSKPQEGEGRTFHSFKRTSGDFSMTFSQKTFERRIVKPRKKMTISSDFSSLKSILKPCMSTSTSGRCLNSKKVCFGKVQFSF